MLKKRCILLMTVCLITGCSSLRFKADLKLAMENYKDAISLYQQYLAENPDAVYERSRLGFAYLKSEQTDNAIAEFQKVLETEPDDFYALLYLGIAYLDKGMVEDAVITLEGYRNHDYPLVEKEVSHQIEFLQTVDEPLSKERLKKVTDQIEQAIKASKEEEGKTRGGGGGG